MQRLPLRPVLLLSAILTGLACASCTPPGESEEQEAAGTTAAQSDCALVWADEFENDGLPDPEKWRYDVGGHGWGNDELQYYTGARPENARVEDGRLIVEARKDGDTAGTAAYDGREYTSARLLTREEWTYGRFEASAKLPSGRGTWPAIWMLPDLSAYGGWPLGGEIDIMEHVGHDPDVVHSTVHTGAYNHSIGTHKGAQIEVPTARTDFNVYAVEWTPEEIRGYVNDEHYFTFENETLVDEEAGQPEWPFDHPFHIILNIAVGGAWGGQQGVDPDIWPQRMEVEYVRVYDCGWGGR
ncbi:MAG: glycoside hydrolase family 16 protein [Rhodothermales bacterium]